MDPFLTLGSAALGFGLVLAAAGLFDRTIDYGWMVLLLGLLLLVVSVCCFGRRFGVL